MGSYLEFPKPQYKAKQLIETFGMAEVISKEEALKYSKDNSKAVICVVVNPAFDAAGFVYNERECRDWQQAHDYRTKTWFVIHNRQSVLDYIGLEEDPAKE